MSEKSKLLEIRDLTVHYVTVDGTVHAVEDLSLELEEGKTLGLVGETGAGKTTTVKAVMQILPDPPAKIIQGEISFMGEDLLKKSKKAMRKIRGKQISMIFQDPMTSLNPVMTVGDQIMEVIRLHDKKLSRKDAWIKACEMLELVGIKSDRATDYPHQFSGGMKQRVIIAMALACNPKLLIADEPTTALDVTTGAQILDMLQEIVRTKNVQLTLITHNLGVAARYADRIYVMYGGRILESGKAEEIFEHPAHPYTFSLMKAIPRLDDDKERTFVPIEGTPPDLSVDTGKCVFYPRCQFRCERCRQGGEPELKEGSKGHFAACYIGPEELEARFLEAKNEKKEIRKKREVLENEPILTVEKVNKYYPVYQGILKKKIADVKALDGVSICLYPGKTLGVVGESGCGKTTLAKSILMLHEITGGKIYFRGEDLVHSGKNQIRDLRAQMSMIFQDPYASLDPLFVVHDTLAEGIDAHHLYKGKEREERIHELLSMVGLNREHGSRFPHEFSGGQRQRIGIARALSVEPELIVCDEPISALDVSIQAQVVNLLKSLQEKMGLSYLFITHDLSMVRQIADRIAVMYLGALVELALGEEIYTNNFHPYTRALLSAIPIADPDAERKRRRIYLSGDVPSPINLPKGCSFCGRCPYAAEECRESRPALRQIVPGHFVACHRAEELA